MKRSQTPKVTAVRSHNEPAPRLSQSPFLTKVSNTQIDRYAELTAELEKNNISSFTGSKPTPLPEVGLVDGVPAGVHRALQRREMRLQLVDDLDRRLPAFKHAQRLRQQDATGFDLVAETNAMLDSKTTVATVLHEYRDECRARDGVERQVAKWSERLMDEASYSDDFQRLRAIEQDDEMVVAGEMAISRSSQMLSNGLSSLSTLQSTLTSTAERIKQEHAIFFNKGKVKSSGVNTEMTFDCGFGSETVAAEDGEDVPGNNSDHELLLLSERRLAKRNDALQQTLELLQKKDREVRRLKGNLELLKAENALNETKWKAIIEATTSGVGFTQLWSMVDSEDASLEESLRAVLARTLETAQQQVTNKAGKIGEDVVQTRDKIQNMDQGDGHVNLIRERNEARMAARHARAKIEVLNREIGLKDEMIAEKDNAIRVLTGQVESVQRVVTAHRDDLTKRDADTNATRLEMATLEEAMAREREMHLEELRQLEEHHRKREEELTASWLQARRDMEVSEHGQENRTAIKTSNLQSKIHELEDLLKTTREVSSAATARVDDLREQVDACGTAVAKCGHQLVAQLGGCLSQLRSFNTAADLDPLRNCTWRALGDALMAVADLCGSDALSMQNSRRTDLTELIAKIRPIVAIDLNPAVDDPRIPAMEREIAALREQNSSFLAKLRSTASTNAENQDQYRRTIQHLKKAVINLVSRRNAEMQALPSVKEGDLTSEQELNDIFRAGFQQLEAEDAEKASEIAYRKVESTKAKSNIIELADSTALPVRQIVQVLSQMCAVLREVTSAYDKQVTPMAARRVQDAKRWSAASSEISLATSLLSDLAAMKSKNHRLIVEAVQIRAKAKGRVNLYTRQFLLAEDNKKELVRRRLNYCEVQAFRAFADVYERFSKLHEERASVLTRIAALVGAWQPVESVSRAPSATPHEGSPLVHPVLTHQERPLSFSRRSAAGVPLSPSGSATIAGLNFLDVTTAPISESPTHKPGNLGQVTAQPSIVSPSSKGLHYDNQMLSGSFAMGESDAVDMARLETQSVQAAFTLLRTAVADAFVSSGRHVDGAAVARRFAVLFDECPGSSKMNASTRTDIEQMYTAMVHTLASAHRALPAEGPRSPSSRGVPPRPPSAIIRTAPALEALTTEPTLDSAAIAGEGGAGNAFWFAMRHDAAPSSLASLTSALSPASQHLTSSPVAAAIGAKGQPVPNEADNGSKPSNAVIVVSPPGSSGAVPLTISANGIQGQQHEAAPASLLEFDEYGFAKRKISAKRLVVAAKAESRDTSTNTDMGLLANFVVRLVRPPVPRITVADVPPAIGARVMPVGFDARSVDDVRILQSLRGAVNEATVNAAAAGVNGEQQRFVAPAQRPTSASRKPDVTAHSSMGRGTPVEMPSRSASAMSTLQFPAVLEIPVQHRTQQQGPQEVTLFPTTSAKDGPRPSTIYSAIAGCLDQHRGKGSASGATPAVAKATTPAKGRLQLRPATPQQHEQPLTSKMLDEVRLSSAPVKPSLVSRLRSANPERPETVSWESSVSKAEAGVLPGASGKQMVMVLRRGAERAEMRLV